MMKGFPYSIAFAAVSLVLGFVFGYVAGALADASPSKAAQDYMTPAQYVSSSGWEETSDVAVCKLYRSPQSEAEYQGALAQGCEGATLLIETEGAPVPLGRKAYRCGYSAFAARSSAMRVAPDGILYSVGRYGR